MDHKLTITIPENAYAALAAAAASASRTPEELAAETVSGRFNEAPERPLLTGDEAREAIRAVMRARGHLVEPTPRPARPGATPLPPIGSPERIALEEELATELGEAFAKSGLSVLDLIERR